MKKVLALIICIYFTLTSAFADVVNLDLDEIIDIGLKNNYELKIQRMELKANESSINIANRLKNPEIQSNITTGNIAYGNASQAGLLFPVEILKRGARKNIAQAEYDVKNTELKKAEHNLKLQIMQAYFDILYAKSVNKIQEERLKLFKQLVQITTDRPKGASYEIDNLKADIQYAQQLIILNKSKANLLAKQFELNKLLNIGSDKIMYDTKESHLMVDWKFLDLKIPEYDFIENIALQYSYLVKISEQNIEKNERELAYAKKQRIPDLNLGGGYTWQAHKDLDHKYGAAYIGFGVSNLPILYNYTPEIQRAQIFLERSKVGKKSYENQLKYELKKDYNIFKCSAENMDYSKKILEDSRKIVKLSMDGYVKGDSTYTDLVINENGYQEVLNAYLTAMSNHFYSYLELMQDIGHDILIEEDLL